MQNSGGNNSLCLLVRRFLLHFLHSDTRNVVLKIIFELYIIIFTGPRFSNFIAHLILILIMVIKQLNYRFSKYKSYSYYYEMTPILLS